jgi:hypothetical protein
MSSLLHYRTLILIFVFLLAACAPDGLDITPTATNTPPPSPTPPPTALPEGFVDPAEVSQATLDIILENLPSEMTAGGIIWLIDTERGVDGFGPLPRIENGVGQKIFWKDQNGGQQMNITFAVFNTVEDATIHYEFIQGIRRPLETGDLNDTFPQPNNFGSGLYGSIAIFQIENVFIEVSIELFSSTLGNPLVSISRATVRFFEEEVQPIIEAGE